MRHQMHQFDYLEEEWDKKIHSKSNCCNDELWSNAQLSDEAPDESITLSEKEEWDEKYIAILIVVMNYWIRIQHHLNSWNEITRH